MSKMPKQKPGKSFQAYGTPWEFIHAVEARFGEIVCDLAASKENAKCSHFYDIERDSLSQSWATSMPTGTLWLNPEFADIAPWAKRCAEESTRRQGLILLLTPASIGTDWFANHVHRKAMVLGLSPRMTFEGCADPYPKDLALACYGHQLSGFDLWRWKEAQRG